HVLARRHGILNEVSARGSDEEPWDVAAGCVDSFHQSDLIRGVLGPPVAIGCLEGEGVQVHSGSTSSSSSSSSSSSASSDSRSSDNSSSIASRSSVNSSSSKSPSPFNICCSVSIVV